MIDLSQITSTSLAGLPLGALFLPGKEGQQRFLAGLLNNGPTLVCLEGQMRFSFADEWSRSPGAAISGIRFEVDPASIALGNELHPLRGALVMIDGVPAIMAASVDGGARAYPIH